MPERPNSLLPLSDRRSYYRIDDELYLEFRPIQKRQVQEFLAGVENQAPGQNSLMSQINALSKQTSAQLKNIRKRHPLIGRYLTALDDKINLLANHVAAYDGTGSGRPNWRVNLSAGGLAFRSQLQFTADTLLAISLKLFPSHREIVTYGPVVYCHFEPDVEPGAPYRTAVTFAFMRESDREALITHILEKQFAAVRAQRQRTA